MKSESSKHHYVVIVLISVLLPLFTWYSSVTYAFYKKGNSVEAKEVEASKPVSAFLHEIIGNPKTFESSSWYAGTWDSTLYLNANHPKTIAIRMELLDKDAHLPIRGVNVSLEGEYWESWASQSNIDAQKNPSWDISVDPEKREPQCREFRLDAISDSKGIVIFSLTWRKKYPWDSKVSDKQTYTVDDEWIIDLDDIEKVERLEIRHPRYRYIEAPVDFKHIVDLKQYEDKSDNNYSKSQEFEALWQNEIKRKNVRLFVLNLGEHFPDFSNKSSQRAQFFEKLREKDYGTVYRDVNDLPNIEHKTKCGPYFVYDLGKILLERAVQQTEVSGCGSILTRDIDESHELRYSQETRFSEKAAGSRDQTSSDTPESTYELKDFLLQEQLGGEIWKCPACGHIHYGEAAPNFCPQCGKSSDREIAQGSEPDQESIVKITQIAQKAGASGTTPGTPVVSHADTKEKTIDFGDGLKMEFVLIPAGEFDMGSPDAEIEGDSDEGPIHKVRISKSFYMGKYEVTQDLYSAVMGRNPSRFQKGTRPVEQVSWEDANAFCKKLSEKYGGSCRLPTEAEWEFACRAGTQNRFYYGEDPNSSQLAQYAWYSKNSGATTHSVGSKKPNSFGLYDMHGNVWEWCSDWYSADYYRQSPDVDPQGPLGGSSRVLRGGGWLLSARCCRSAIRGGGEPGGRSNRGGFRVVLDVD